jgi:large subunit ribosomal protein L5e
MKGAADGGLEVPHNTRRFPGFKAETKKFDPAVLRKYIFGGHVADYQKKLQADNAEKYKQQFSQYVKAGIKPDGIEAMWAGVHKAIRANPAFVATTKKTDPKPKQHLQQKKNNKQRKNRVKQLLASAERAAAQ